MSDPERAAVERVLASRPAWTGMRRVADVVGEGRRVLLHAGPPYVPAEEAPDPVRNSLAFACVYEGWAGDWDEAFAALDAGSVELRAAQDHDVLVPLAGVASPSMALAEVSDGDARAFAVLNEGASCASRLGRRDERLPEHHRWLNGELADWLEGGLGEPVELLPLLRESLDRGDDGHSRTGAGSELLAEVLLARASGPVPERVSAFLGEAAAFALNLWMAAVACALSGARGVPGAGVVTRAGGNGRRAGLQLGEGWITAAAPTPSGPVEPAHAGLQVLPAVGDSAILDVFGLGGQIAEPARAEAVLCAPHPALGDRFVVTSASRVVAAGRGPLVVLGMIEAAGEAGRIGGGRVEWPVELFR